MHYKIASLLKIIPSIVLAVTLPVSIAHAVPYCAETISSSTIYSLEADAAGGAITSQVLWSGGSDLGGIAAYDKYVFVTDNANGKSYLRVFDLTTRSQVGSVLIGTKGESGVQGAGHVSVDSSGNVYVIDSSIRNSSARFAQIVNWETPNSAIVNYASVTGYSHVDIAGVGSSDASILLQSDTNTKRMAFVTWNGVSTNPTKYEISSSSTPVAITANKTTNNSYVLSATNSLVNGVPSTTTLLRTITPGVVNPTEVAITGVGQDVAMTSDGMSDYATVIGVEDTGLHATRVGLTNGVATSVVDNITIASGDEGDVHYAESSEDGKMLWVTAEESGKVYAVSGTKWLDHMASDKYIGDHIGAIATHAYYQLVPEPSSLIALLTMGAGALGILRRKK